VIQYLVHTASIATRSAASGSAGVTVLVSVAVAVEGAAALLRVALGAGDIAAGELAGDVGVEWPVEVTAGEDCGAREADATGAADEVDVARGGGSCRCTPEELLEHPVKTALLNATTARMATRTTRLMLSTSSHEHVYSHQGGRNFGPPQRRGCLPAPTVVNRIARYWPKKNTPTGMARPPKRREKHCTTTRLADLR